MRKVILDTDIGDDIDDAFALALLSSLPEAEILGVTTVFRNVAQRAQQAQALLQKIGKEIPVYAGERFPLKEPFHLFAKDTDVPPEIANLPQWGEECAHYPVQEGAVEFLVETAKRYQKELTIFAVGPLTNLAKAIMRDGEAMKNVGAIYLMGGCFSYFEAEWNVLCDPEAAQTVYACGAPVYSVGMDITMQCALEPDLMQKFYASQKESNKLLVTWLDRWFNFFAFQKSVMHDPLAVASAFANVCKFEKRYVKVDLEQTRGAVFTQTQPCEGYFPIHVATEVDKHKFFSLIEAGLLS